MTTIVVGDLKMISWLSCCWLTAVLRIDSTGTAMFLSYLVQFILGYPKPFGLEGCSDK